MRVLLMASCVVLLQGPAWANETLLTFNMVDLDVEVRQGVAHLVDVSLEGGEQLRLQDRSLIPMADGGYSGVVKHALPDGSVTAVFQIQQRERVFSGRYAIVGGSGSYAGAHGEGSLTTLTGRDAAASSSGVYQVQLQVRTPDHRIAADE